MFKYSDIVSAKGALKGVMKLKIPVKNSLQIARLDVSLDKPLDEFIRTRDALFEQYKIVSKDGQLTSEKREDVEGFVSDFNDLLKQEVDVDFTPIELPDIEIEPEILVALNKFLKE